MRLQKFLAHAGICSRRKAEEHITNGRVQVNGAVVTALGTKVDPEIDKVLFDGQPVSKTTEKKIYIAVNKPSGVITSCSHGNEKIIIDFIDVKERVYPVGRLDKDSEGLVLLTNDGELHNRLSHPTFNHEKEYIVTCANPIADQDLKQMASGMIIDGKKTRKAAIKRITKYKFNMVLKQGLNRQIRKMVGKTGNRVARLLRVRMANILLSHMKPGKWRYLTSNEIKILTAEPKK